LAGQFDVTRRRIIVAGGALLIAPFIPATGRAGPGEMAAELAKIVQGRPVKAEKVKLEIAELAENGFSVPALVTVDSPMTATDHVKTIYILSEKNPLPNVVRFHLSPRAGRARVATSIRLADTQRITAIAETSTGALYSAHADVIVTLSACLETG
jgi:sulfur-oxidizing protein SoxY